MVKNLAEDYREAKSGDISSDTINDLSEIPAARGFDFKV